MIVYKFGGASVKSAEGIRNIAKIVSGVDDELFIVVSAMGKTTNAMELVLDAFMKANRENALEKFTDVEKYHLEIINEIFKNPSDILISIKSVFEEVRTLIDTGIGDDYDKWYDRLVSYGEIISTKIISYYLISENVDNEWLDMRDLLVTDSNFREANVRMYESETRLRQAVNFHKNRIYIGQGFIGANINGNPTTLGREGSDYTAAVVGNLLDAKSVSIWKDVPGILNADPRCFPDTVLIPELSYIDAVELAYSGAQIIHPKTIKPLENKQIPLYVRPFGTPNEKGSVIKSATEKSIDIPILILRKNMVLVTLRPHDFSFVLEECLSEVFTVLNKHRMKVALIQSSALRVSVCVDNNRYLSAAIDELGNNFKVTYNTDLELLTIRGRNKEIVERTTSERIVLLSQFTRRNARFLMKS